MSGVNLVNKLFAAVVLGLAIVGSCHAGSDKAAAVYNKAITLQPDLENGQQVYEICASCHLQEGWGFEDGTYPQIAGQYRLVLIQQLSDIRAHNRDNPTMYPFALPEAIGDAQDLADVAGYIEKMKMTSGNGKGEWVEGSPEFELGKKLYSSHCAECHGENGAGDPSKLYPRIHGQHYNYLLRQLQWMQDGRRRSVKHDMLKNINSFSAADIAQVANYISRLAVPAKDLAK